MPEYNPINEQLKKQYEDALIHGKYRERKTVDAVWKALNLFEKFTGKKDFPTFNAEQAKSFKHYLEKQKNAQDEPLSVSTVRSTLANVREFFLWLSTHPKYIRKVDGRAAHYLHLSNNDNRAARASRERPAPRIEDVCKALAAMPHKTDVEKRDRAIFAFICITGVRDAALISLKQGDVDIEEKTVWQNPRHVKTKNRKGIVTKFMGGGLPQAEEIVMEWLFYCRDELKLPKNAALFPSTLVGNNPETFQFESAGLSKEHWANAQPVRDIFKTAFERVGVAYHNPHSFRKMIVGWALKNCSQYEFKALSQNIGHEHAMVTYNSYGGMPTKEQTEAIENIGKGNADLKGVSTEAILAEARLRLKQ